MRAFFVLAYPRSRTTWLSHALTSWDSVCLHEGLLGVRSIAELHDKMAAHGQVVGNSDSGNLLFVDAIRRTFADARFVCVYRPEREVAASLLRHGIGDVGMKPLRAAMQRVRAMPDVLHVHYHDLSKPETGRAIWEHCIGGGFDAAHWISMCAHHIESDLKALRDQVKANWAAMQELVNTDGVASWR